jgi:hypothetical protein
MLPAVCEHHVSTLRTPRAQTAAHMGSRTAPCGRGRTGRTGSGSVDTCQESCARAATGGTRTSRMLRNPSRLVAHWFPRDVYIWDATARASARARTHTERTHRAESPRRRGCARARRRHCARVSEGPRAARAWHAQRGGGVVAVAVDDVVQDRVYDLAGAAVSTLGRAPVPGA